MELLVNPNVSLEQLYDAIPSLKHLDPRLQERVIIEGISKRHFTMMDHLANISASGRYKPYLRRQAAEVAALKRDEDLKLDINLDYSS